MLGLWSLKHWIQEQIAMPLDRSHPGLAVSVKPTDSAAEDLVIAQRQARSTLDKGELDNFGRRLLLDLDVGLSLARTAHLYPHIVNRLALVWTDAQQLESYLDSVLITDRTGRMGLDFMALCELNEIREVRLPKLYRAPSITRARPRR
jgi:uncharacterized membrane protein YebE (DUF533 family)